jgi:hypothetical protein
MNEIEAKADDSDYYTPEDPHTTILSPVKSPAPIEKVNRSYRVFLQFSSFLLNRPTERHSDPTGRYQRHRTTRQSHLR